MQVSNESECYDKIPMTKHYVYDHIVSINNSLCNKSLFKLLGLFYIRKSTIQSNSHAT